MIAPRRSAFDRLPKPERVFSFEDYLRRYGRTIDPVANAKAAAEKAVREAARKAENARKQK